MKTYLLFLLMTITATLKGQSFCGLLPDSVMLRYRNTADRLALQYTFQENSAWKDSIRISSNESERILRALTAVYTSQSAQRDTVVELYNIQERGNPNMNYINVTADSNVSWIKEIRKGLRPSSSHTLDSLCVRYGTRVISIYPWNFGASSNVSILFLSDSNYNMSALHKEFKKVENMLYVEDGVFGMDGNNIQASKHTGFTELSYSLGLGDCPSGCTFRKYWTFRIFPDCRVEFVGKLLTGLEDKSLEESLVVFPNPFQDQVHFSGAMSLSEMKLYDGMGNLVRSKKADEVEFSNIGSLSKGVYLLEFQKPSGTGTYKLIKE